MGLCYSSVNSKVDDIIELIVLNNLSPQASLESMVNWYNYAVAKGMVETVYENGELIGFLDWVRLSKMPHNQDEARILFTTSPTAPVAMACNCVVVRGDGTLRKLVRAALSKNRNCQIVWHDRKTDRMVSFSRNKILQNRRKSCNIIAEC